jgi:hypothetical protein
MKDARDTAPRRAAARTSLATVLIAVFVLSRLLVRARECLDGDEIFGLRTARLSWGELWTWLASVDSHPPLFYALLKSWLWVGGESLSWLRLLPVLTACAGLVALMGLSRALELEPGERLGIVALVSLNAFLLPYSINLRMFALLQTASAFSLWAFAGWIRKDSRAATGALLLANAVLVYSHYWGWLFVACEAAYLMAFARKKIPAFTGLVAALVILYVPWALAVVTSGRGSYTSQISWISLPSVIDPLLFYGSLVGGFRFAHSGALGLLLTATPVALWAWHAVTRNERAETFWFLSWFAVLPVALTFAACFIIGQSVWAPRSLVVSAMPYIALVTVAAYRLKGAWGRTVAFAVTGWVVVAGAVSLASPHKLHWDELAAQMASAPRRTDAVSVYTFEPFVAETLDFYVSEFHPERAFRVERIDAEALEGIDADHFWVVYRDKPDRRFPLSRDPERLLRARGYLLQVVSQIADGSQSVRAVSARKGSAAATP